MKTFSIRLPIVLLSAVLLPAVALGADESKANPGLSLLNDAITFYASFDSENVSADLANGQADPVAVEGKATFMPGRYGKALLVGIKGGGAYVTYATPKNVDFTKPGALSFWATPVEWIQPGEKPERPYLHLLDVPGNHAGALIIERMGFNLKPKRADRLLLGYFNMPKLKQAMAGYNSLHWQANDWRLVVLNWDTNGFSSSFDGSAPGRVEFSRRLEEDDFAAAGKKAIVHIGNGGTETTLIDELTFYKRPLSADEIKALAAK